MTTYRRQSLARALTGRLLCGAALGVIGFLPAAPALAQAAGDSSSATTVQSVVVTAERRTTNVQKTAIPVTVFTGADLSRKAIYTVDDLQFTTPSLVIQDSGAGALINIRGIGKSDGGQQVAPGTLVYRDGVSVSPGGIFTDEPYYDISSVEVLRGPQGTFAGDNSTGGAIFITETNPQLHSFGGWAEAQYGNYDDVRVRGAVNLPIGADFALRIATNDEQRDTFSHVTGAYTGNPGAHKETDWRASALWQPTDAFKAVLKLDANYIENGGVPAAPYTGSTSNLFNVGSNTHLLGIERELRGVLQLSYVLKNGVTLKSITGLQRSTDAIDRDADGTSATNFIYHARVWDQTASEEVNILSPDTGRFQWVVGGVYQADTVGQPEGQNWLSLSNGGTPAIGSGGFALLADKYHAAKTNWGVFGQGTFDLTDSLKLQVGARYSQTKFVLDNLSEELFSGFPLAGERVNGETEQDSRVTGKVNLEWTLDPNNFLYAFVATGHKGGGINGIGTLSAPPFPPATPAQQPPKFAPEEVTDYELGWKANFFDNHLHTQLGAFYNDYQDFQVAIYQASTGLGQVLNASGHTTIDGFEAQGQAQFGSFSFDFGGSYLNTALGNFQAIDSRHVGSGVQNLTGRQQPNAPHWTAQFGAQYVFDLPGNATLTPRAEYGIVGSRWATLFDVAPGDFLAADSVVNAQLTYARPDNWQLTAYATNLLNFQYVSSTSLGNLGIPGPPRQFGVRASKSF